MSDDDYERGRRETLAHLRTVTAGLLDNARGLAAFGAGALDEARCRMLAGMLLNEVAQLQHLDDYEKEIDEMMARAEELCDRVREELGQLGEVADEEGGNE